ncbi:MlaA family lipoprotein [Neptuniibacter halophilus]|uniref:MlaA family lipoprotein n=1 Tax=Neptuniibacter halophilus TaxID=651666 RepID=UPI0025731388|nr:VacJ family lipoprotein [Neptuniibacter halophilus]
MKSKLRNLLLTGALSAALIQPAVAEDVDPWEGFNRTMFSFNDGLDTYALKPLAKGYKAVMPEPAEKGVNNFFENLADIGTMINNLLQGKFNDAGQDLGRVAFNTTFGLAGLIDVATPMGIPKHDEDFGQTFGYWGMESGPYLVLPFFGPSSVRDGIGLIPDTYTDPVYHVGENGDRNALYVVRVIDKRAQLLESEKLISGDKYTFIRDAYLQKRAYEIADGNIENYDDSNF